MQPINTTLDLPIIKIENESDSTETTSTDSKIKRVHELKKENPIHESINNEKLTVDLLGKLRERKNSREIHIIISPTK